MTADSEMRSQVLVVLGEIAPEAATVALSDDDDLRDALDLDSMDILNFAIALSKHFQLDIPEAAYGTLTTLGGSLAYLRSARVRND